MKLDKLQDSTADAADRSFLGLFDRFCKGDVGNRTGVQWKEAVAQQ